MLDAPSPPGEAASVEAPPVRVWQLGKVHYDFTTTMEPNQHKEGSQNRRSKQEHDGCGSRWGVTGGVGDHGDITQPSRKQQADREEALARESSRR